MLRGCEEFLLRGSSRSPPRAFLRPVGAKHDDEPVSLAFFVGQPSHLNLSTGQGGGVPLRYLQGDMLDVDRTVTGGPESGQYLSALAALLDEGLYGA